MADTFNTLITVVLVLGLLVLGYFTYMPLQKRCEFLYKCVQDSENDKCVFRKKQKETQTELQETFKQINLIKNKIQNDTKNFAQQKKIKEHFAEKRKIQEICAQQRKIKEHFGGEKRKIKEFLTYEAGKKKEAQPLNNKQRETIISDVRNVSKQIGQAGHPWIPPQKLQPERRTHGMWSQDNCNAGLQLIKDWVPKDTHQNHHRRHTLCRFKSSGLCDYFNKNQSGNKCFKRICSKDLKCGWNETHHRFSDQDLMQDIRQYNQAMRREARDTGFKDGQKLFDTTSYGDNALTSYGEQFHRENFVVNEGDLPSYNL